MKVLWTIAFAAAAVPALVAQTPEANALQTKKDKEAQEQVRKLEQDFVDAFAKGTKAAAAHFERVLADEAIITENTGDSLGKAAFLEMAKKGDRGPVRHRAEGLEDSGIRRDCGCHGGKGPQGTAGSGDAFTHVYVHGTANGE